MSAIPGGVVVDPQGDATAGDPDIASFSACHTDVDLQLTVRLFTPWTDSSAVVIALDADRNPGTGVDERGRPGCDFNVSTIGHQGIAFAEDLVSNHFTQAALTVGVDSVSIRVPLAAIGNDDGLVDAVAFVGRVGTMIIPISDEAPDAGLLTSVTCDGSVSTTTTPATTTTTLPSGDCSSNGECDDRDPCTQDECVGGRCAHPLLGGGVAAECEVTRLAGLGCSPKLQGTIARKLARARAAIDKAMKATTSKRKAAAKAAATSTVRAIATKAARLAGKGRIPPDCAQQIADAMQRLQAAIAAI